MTTKTIEFKKISIDLTNQWIDLFQKCNWYNFDIIKFTVEKDYVHGMFELELYLLCFGVRFYWTWNEEMLESKIKEYNNILEKGEFVKW